MAGEMTNIKTETTMNRIVKISVCLLAGCMSMLSCQKEFKYVFADKGPDLKVNSFSESAYMGGEIEFSVDISDSDFDLSTLKAQLFFDQDMVSDTTIRTRQNGTYTGKLSIPFLANIPDGNASLVFVGQNVGQAITKDTVEVAVSRPEFSYLTLKTEDQTYRMEKTSAYTYSATGDFPAQCNAVIESSEVPGTDRTLTFGWNGTEVEVGAESEIPFSNSVQGYTITFNTKTFEASPFITIYVNGEKAKMVDGNNYSAVVSLKQNGSLQITGYDHGFSDWRIDPDYIETVDDAGEYTFLPVDGLYKVNIDFANKFFKFEAMKSTSELATLNADGTGAVWLIGDTKVGKPTMAQGASWSPEAGGLCLSQIEPKKFQITLVAGVQLATDAIDFKFFHQKTWGGEFGGGTLTTDSQLVTVGETDGNIHLADGVTLELGGVYRFVLDLTAATVDNSGSNMVMSGAVLSVVKDGEEEIPTEDITVNGQKMEMVTANKYTAVMDLTQGSPMTITGLSDMMSYYLDPDYLSLDGASLRFAATTGRYRVDLDTDVKYARFSKVKEDGSNATFAEGALWLLGYGVGYPYNKDELGWNTSNAYCIAEVSPKVFQFTGVAVKQGDATVRGGKIRYDYISMKYYCGTNWEGETGNVTFVGNAAEQLEQSGGETNIKLKGEGDKKENPDGVVHLEEGATYRFTFDLSACTFDGEKLSGEQKVNIEKIQ